MTEPRILARQPWLTVVLVLVLSLAGVGRGWALAPGAVEAAPVIAGVAVAICHHAPDDGDGPDDSGQHTCCDACALCAPVLLPGTPDLTAPVRVIHHVSHAAALRWAPIIGRPRTPRLAQGPPAA